MLINEFLQLTTGERKYWTQAFCQNVHTFLESDVLDFIEDLREAGYDMTAEAIEAVL